MQAHERIIRDRFTRNTCTNCGVYHSADDVLVLARRSRAWLVLVTCHECQRRGIYVVTFPRPAKSNVADTPPDAAESLSGPTTTRPNAAPMWPDLWQEPELRIERQALHLPPNPNANYQSFQSATDSTDSTTPTRPDEAPATPPHTPYTPPAPPAPPSPPVTRVDVEAMRRFLSAFDGDFQRLFNLGNLGEQA